MLLFVLWVVRIANWLNWVMGALFAFLFALMLAYPTLFQEKISVAAGDVAYYWLVAVIGLAFPTVWLLHIIFTRLSVMIRSAPTDECFSEDNVRRLTLITWSLLGINIIDLLYGGLSAWANEASDEYFCWSLGMTGWFVVLLLFILTRVFREGARMRKDLEGIV